jgi:hypothetical protein
MHGRVLAIVVALRFHAYADPTEDAALLHLDRGIAAFDAKDFKTAERELTIAHDLAPSKANPYRWLALTEIQLGDCVAATGHIDGFLARVPPDDARIPEMTRWREFCRKSLEPRSVAPPPDKPLRTRWWFWPAVGTAAVAITGVTVYALTHTGEPTLPPVRCTNAGCTP